MALKCKNCGGNIVFDSDLNLIVCDCCGVSQPLDDISGNITDGSIEQIIAYRQALEHFADADTPEALSEVCKELEELGELFNCTKLAQECRHRVELLVTEQDYQMALLDMQSDDPQCIQSAINTFERLGDYKESAIKLGECRPLLETAQIEFDAQLQEYERKRVKNVKKARRRRRFFLFLFIVVITAVVALYYKIHSPANISVSVSPADNYVTEKYSDYVFNYDIIIHNKSPLDVTAVEAEVYFEQPDGTVLLSAGFDAGSTIYSSDTVVLGKKSAKYSWSVTVSSDSIAKQLYQYDFDKLNVEVKIKKLRYKNGKVRSY